MTTPSNPNTGPTNPNTGAEALALTYFFLSPDNVQAMRDEQGRIMHDAMNTVNPFDLAARDAAEIAANTEIAAQRERYLKHFGIEDDNPDHQRFLDMLGTFSVDQMSEVNWVAGHNRYNPDGSTDYVQSGRDLLAAEYSNLVLAAGDSVYDDAEREYQEHLDAEATAAETEAQRLRDEEAAEYRQTDAFYSQTREAFEETNAKLAKHGAKRAGHYRSIRTRKEHDNLRLDFEDAMSEHARCEMHAQELSLGRHMTDEEARQFALSYALGAEQGLQEKTNDEMTKTKLAKFVESPAFRYAFTQTFTEGKWAGRAEVVAKGVLIGAGFTAALGPILGAGLGSALLALRAGKNYAQIDAARGRALDVIGDTESTESRTAAAESIGQSIDQTGENWRETLDKLNAANARAYESAIIKEQNKRIKSGAIALGVTALGGAFAYGMAAWSDALEASRADSPQYTVPGERIEPGGTDAPTPSLEDTGETADIDLPGSMGTDTMDHGIAGNPNVYQFDADSGVAPEHQAGYEGNVHSDGQEFDLTTDAEGGNEAIDKTAVIDTGPETAPNSLNVYQGQGWNEVMQQIGIPSSEWGQALQDAGPELRDLGYAYWDRDLGGYGILMPTDGKLPQSALNILLRHSS